MTSARHKGRLLIAAGLFLSMPLMSVASEVILTSMPIRYGIESQISLTWPLENKNKIYSSKHFMNDNNLAEEAGVYLPQYFLDSAVSDYDAKKKKFFMLFYNMAEAPGCDREYLIQRVKLTKTDFDINGKVLKKDKKYLVEIMKTLDGKMKRADRHIKKYSLNRAYTRHLSAQLEIGCGKIKDLTPAKAWPFSRSKLYKLAQNYSSEPGLYHQVNFEFSRAYSYSFMFSKDGNHSVTWPDFMLK
ncbi:hypothetical protein L4C36_07675 [Photobacterium japonica]|uniref:hypothetical protein n=1 Tax=Photobacterium japonica TaxID=2910235 RepID=UPI003D0FC421